MRRLLPAFLVAAAVLVTTTAFAQNNDNRNTAPDLRARGADLIAWTQMQQPEPVPPAQAPEASPQASPQPEPRPETPPPQTEPAPQTQPPQAQPGQPANPGQQTSPDEAQGETPQPAAQTFTGTITKEGDSYVLKVSDTTSYQLDDQDKAKQFDGQKVRVLGGLDSSSNLIHVQQIEPLT